jgi:1-acyl-sn-glycerol-3-phosphate acyltransferase
MNVLYQSCRLATRFIGLCTQRVGQIRAQVPDRDGGYVLAMSHLSHLEPVCVSTLLSREVDWMTRREFYHGPFVSWVLDQLNCFQVNRQGIPVSSIRCAIGRVRAGRVVGIFPEGGVVQGKESVVRGGPVRKGVCSVAIHSGAPIIPCVMLGTHRLLKVWPWLPFKWGKIWVAYGEPICPPAMPSTREKREELAEELRAAFQRLYGELRERYGIGDGEIP